MEAVFNLVLSGILIVGSLVIEVAMVTALIFGIKIAKRKLFGTTGH